MASKLIEATTWPEIVGKMLPVLCVVIGALLTAVIAWCGNLCKRRRLIKALYVELHDQSQWLHRSKLLVEQMIQEIACSYMPDGLPVPAPTYIYDQHISELAFYLTESERTSFNAIHNSMVMVRRQHNELAEIRVKFASGDVPSFNRYVQLLHASYSNLCLLVCYVDYHLHFRRRLNVHQVTGNDAREVEKQTRERMIELIKKQKQLGSMP